MTLSLYHRLTFQYILSAYWVVESRRSWVVCVALHLLRLFHDSFFRWEYRYNRYDAEYGVQQAFWKDVSSLVCHCPEQRVVISRWKSRVCRWGIKKQIPSPDLHAMHSYYTSARSAILESRNFEDSIMSCHSVSKIIIWTSERPSWITWTVHSVERHASIRSIR